MAKIVTRRHLMLLAGAGLIAGSALGITTPAYAGKGNDASTSTNNVAHSQQNRTARPHNAPTALQAPLVRVDTSGRTIIFDPITHRIRIRPAEGHVFQLRDNSGQSTPFLPLHH